MRTLGLALALVAALAAPAFGAPAWPLAEAGPARKVTGAGRVFHLNCGTFSPPSPWLVSGEGPLFGTSELVNHCLLVETDRGLVLVDTGLGTEDVRSPHNRFNWGWFTLIRPVFARAETARHQVERLGFRPQDVTDIVLTHLDVDHIGGLPDFPHARVHLTRAEYGRVERGTDFYAALRWAHGPEWRPRTLEPGTWRGLASTEVLPGATPEVRLVGLPGHSAGHAGVAVRQGEGWIFHVGDAYYHRAEVSGPTRRCPPALDAMQRLKGSHDPEAFSATQAVLRNLRRDPRVQMVSAHDPVESWAVGPRPLLPLVAEAGR